MDFITLSDIAVRTRIGVTENERRQKQDLLVSVELFGDLSRVAATDDVCIGIDYARVVEEVVALGETERRTIERFAEDAAQMILTMFKPAGGVKVTVTKTPPLALRSASVTVIRP